MRSGGLGKGKDEAQNREGREGHVHFVHADRDIPPPSHAPESEVWQWLANPG